MFARLIHIIAVKKIDCWNTIGHSAAKPLRTSGSLSNSLEVLFLHSPNRHCAGVHKVFHAEVIDATSRQNHIGAGCDDFKNSSLGNIRLSEMFMSPCSY